MFYNNICRLTLTAVIRLMTILMILLPQLLQGQTAKCVSGPLTAKLDGNGVYVVDTLELDNGSVGDTLFLSDDTLTCLDLGSKTVQLFVQDFTTGQIAACPVTFNVIDTVKPTILFKPLAQLNFNLDATPNGGTVTIQGSDVDDGSFDNCSIASTEVIPNTFGCNELGLQPIAFVAVDGVGNSDTINTLVNIKDVTPPTISNIDTITLNLDASGQATVTFPDVDNGSTDNCQITNTVLTPSTFDCNDIGNYILVQISVEDGEGNSSIDTSYVFIEDNINPTAICRLPNDTLIVDLDAVTGAVTILPNQIDNGSFDNCSTLSLAISGKKTFFCTDIGARNVVLEATDGSGLTDVCSANIFVRDVSNPTAECKDITVSLNNNGLATITANDIDDGSLDNCSNVANGTLIRNLSKTSFSCDDIGSDTILYTVTDASGNFATCISTITIVDNITPVARCTSNVTLQLDDNGLGVLNVADIDSSSTLKCFSTLVLSDTLFDCSDISGSPIVDMSIIANDGLVLGTCQSIIDVVDITPPEVDCRVGVTVYLDAAGVASITTNDVVLTAKDSCNVLLSLSDEMFDCNDVNTPTFTTLTASDGYNQTSCPQTIVIVQDTVTPVAYCKDITLNLDTTGIAYLTANDINDGSFDNCTFTMSTDRGSIPFTCDDIGVNNVLLFINDNHGNIDTCLAKVTVKDNIGVQAICKAEPVTLALDATGNATLLVTQIDSGSINNCGNLNLSKINFDCGDLGFQPVTLDVDGQSSCQSVVHVVDNIAPTVQTKNIDAYLNGLGEVTIDKFDLIDTMYDNCGIDVVNDFNVSQLTFYCTDLGATTVNIIVQDEEDNVINTTAIVNVRDTTSPIAKCKSFTAQLDATGNVTLLASQIDDTSIDNCGISSYLLSENTFDCSNIGANQVFLTVFDQSNNLDVCETTVTVEDITAPTDVCVNTLTKDLNSNGDASITVSDINISSFDECTPILSYNLDKSSFDCDDLGANIVTLSITDDGNNTATCQATVTIRDLIKPVATCNGSKTLYLDNTGEANLTPMNIDNGSFDNCSIDTMWLDRYVFTCNDIGSLVNVTMTVKDIADNEETCISQITVLDTVSPNTICQDITVYLDSTGNTSITTNQIDNNSSDNCTSITPSIDITSFDCNDIGNSPTVTLSASDGTNITSCNATVTVLDTVSPSAKTFTNVDVYLNVHGVGSLSTSEVNNNSTDACGIANITLDRTTFSCNDIANNPIAVTMTVEDLHGNLSSAITYVTVRDTVRPFVECESAMQVYLNNSGIVSIAPQEVFIAARDTCGISMGSLRLSQSAFMCDDWGANHVDVIIEDIHGNEGSCPTTITVLDTVQPIAICNPVTAFLNSNGVVWVSPDTLDNGSLDNCDLTFDLNQRIFNCNDLGVNPVTFFANDGHGNIDFCLTQIEIKDNILPVASCVGDIYLTLDTDGEAEITPQMVDSLSTDNCNVNLDSLSKTLYTCTDLGAFPVTLYISDDDGNTATCQSVVHISDNIPPTALAVPTIDIVLDSLGTATILPSDVNNGSFDNCTIANMWLSQSVYDCSDIGTTTSAILFVEDQSGNQSQAIFVTNVIDNRLPTAICTTAMTLPISSGQVFISVADINNNSFDACGIPNSTYILSQTAFDCSDVGTSPNIVTLTMTDVNGNTASCTSAITIDDVDPPTALCKTTVNGYLDANGQLTIDSSLIDNGSSDLCSGIATMALNTYQFDCTDIGNHAITMTVTDNGGKSSTCNTVLTVSDTTSPYFITFPDDTVVVNDTTDCGAIVTWSSLQITNDDNCSNLGISISSTYSPGDFFPVGTTTVVYTITDLSGNQEDTSFNVTVIDTEAPIISGCPTSGFEECAGTTITWPAPTVTDNCDTLSFVSNYYPGYNFPITAPSSIPNPTVVQYVATDIHGNVSTCTFEVEINDSVRIDLLTAEPSCFSLDDGIVSVSATHGTPPYSYQWSSGANTSGDTGVVAGIYSVTVTDDKQCTVSGTIELTQPDILALTEEITNVKCFSENNGAINISISGGTGSRTYLWSTGQQTQDIQNLTAGFYEVTITDANGCELSSLINVQEPDLLQIQGFVAHDISCFGYSDGYILDNTVGGTFPYYKIWTNSSTNYTLDTLDGVPADLYDLMLIDANGCRDSNSVRIEEPDPIQSLQGVETEPDLGDLSGKASITITGGTEPFIYSWNDAIARSFLQDSTVFGPTDETTHSIEGLHAGFMATVYIEDSNECKYIDSTIVGGNFRQQVYKYAITPNGDDFNDVFVFMENLETFFPQNRLEIFNRWGELVFSQRQYQNNWNGTYKHTRESPGKELAHGTYYFVFKGTDINGIEKQIIGTITILNSK